MKETAKRIPHQSYYNKDKIKVPGVTTVLNILSKPNLLDWAWKCGLKNIDYKAERDTKADIGTLAHKMITEKLMGNEIDTSDYLPEEIDKAENCVISFWTWYKQNPIKVEFVEKQMVSEKYQFGGCCDIYGSILGIPMLIDLKTGKAIYEEFMYQLAAYKQLLIDNGYPVKLCKIIRIGREENEGFEVLDFEDTEIEMDIFLNALSIYNLKKLIKKEDEFYNYCKEVSDKKGAIKWMREHLKMRI